MFSFDPYLKSRDEMLAMATEAEASGYIHAAKRYREIAEQLPNFPRVQLTGWGLQAAKPCTDIKIGDVLVKNYGCEYEVTAIKRETNAYRIFEIKTIKSVGGDVGKHYEDRHKKTRLVPCLEESL